MGITGVHAIPMMITCILQGTLCDTGIPCTFYGENICSVGIQKYPQLQNSFEFGPYSIAAQSCCVDIRTFVLILALKIQVDSQGHRK